AYARSFRPSGTIGVSRTGCLETNDPGRLTTRIGGDGMRAGRAGRRGRSGALTSEAVAAVDGLAAGGLERDLGLAAAGRAGGLEHLAGPAIARTVAAAPAVARSA